MSNDSNTISWNNFYFFIQLVTDTEPLTICLCEFPHFIFKTFLWAMGWGYQSSPSVTDRGPKVGSVWVITQHCPSPKGRAETWIVADWPQPLAPLWGGEECGQPKVVSPPLDSRLILWDPSLLQGHKHLSLPVHSGAKHVSRFQHILNLYIPSCQDWHVGRTQECPSSTHTGHSSCGKGGEE